MAECKTNKDTEQNKAEVALSECPARPQTTAETIGTEADGKNEKKSEYGKFRNPEELLRAYGELEREFTRRSQKLAELEKTGQRTQYSPDEEEWKAAVDGFFDALPSARGFAKEIAAELIAHPELKQDSNCLNNALTRVLLSKWKSPRELITDGQFLKEYVLSSDSVKQAVINEYLQNLREGKPPLALRGGGQALVTPMSKPKSIEEAGKLFLKNN